MISTIASTQVYKQTSPIVKKSMTHLFIYRLRNYGDLESIVNCKRIKCDLWWKKTTLLQIYHEAVSEDHNSLYVHWMPKYKRKMFMERFQRYLIPS